MRVCVVHNLYRHPGGEETVVENICSLLAGHGHVVVPFFRHSDDIPRMLLGRVRAFFSGIYSFSSKKAMRALLATSRPDIVNVHNLFPLISPSVLTACHETGVPIVMTLHNYRLSCPHGMHVIDGHVCERCLGGREYWCVLRNCEGSVPKSLGYAVRSMTARTFRFYADNVTIYVVFTQFHRNRLVSEGIPSARVMVIPNMALSEQTAPSHPLGDYVACAGRVSPEKGIATLMRAARKCLDIPFKIAGSYERRSRLVADVPENVVFLGHLTGTELKEFYKSARMLVMPSVWFETFGMSLVEAMAWRKPAIVSRIGALTEIVDEGVTGLAAEPGNAEELAETIRYLWDRPDLCRQMGQAGREKALREYSPRQHYERLMAVYEAAVRLGPPRNGET
jgi:glycosyltransferase involved in cell wall biosynthesis